MFTKFKTVKKTKKAHDCYECCKRIDTGSTCTYGVTTDSEIVRYKKEIMTAYFCTDCRDISLN